MLGMIFGRPLLWTFERCDEVPTKLLESVLDEVALCVAERNTHSA